MDMKKIERLLKNARMVSFEQGVNIKYWNGFYYENEQICSVAIVKTHIVVNVQRLLADDYIYFKKNGEMLNERCIGNLREVQCDILNKIYNWV
jgi:N-acetylneuraminic acid mutarotase